MEFISRLSTSAQRRVYRALLCRAIGRYLEGDLALEQLDVHLRAGTIDLHGLALNVDAVNAMLAGEPVRVLSGKIDHLRCTFASLSGQGFAIHLSGARLTLEPAPAAAGARAAIGS